MTHNDFGRTAARHLFHNLSAGKLWKKSGYFWIGFGASFLLALLSTGYLLAADTRQKTVTQQYQAVFFPDAQPIGEEYSEQYEIAAQGIIHYGKQRRVKGVSFLPVYPDRSARTLIHPVWESGGFPEKEKEAALSRNMLQVLGYESAQPGDRISVPGIGSCLLCGIFLSRTDFAAEPVILYSSGSGAAQNGSEEALCSAVCFRFRPGTVPDEEILRSHAEALKNISQPKETGVLYSDPYLRACGVEFWIPAVFLFSGIILILSLYFLSFCAGRWEIPQKNPPLSGGCRMPDGGAPAELRLPSSVGIFLGTSAPLFILSAKLPFPDALFIWPVCAGLLLLTEHTARLCTRRIRLARE